jgi:hypothetical protein
MKGYLSYLTFNSFKGKFLQEMDSPQELLPKVIFGVLEFDSTLD